MGYSGAENTTNIFKNNRIRLNSTRAFDWCINYHTWYKKKIRFFLVRVPPFGKKKGLTFFFPGKTIYTPIESPDGVEKRNDDFKNF